MAACGDMQELGARRGRAATTPRPAFGDEGRERLSEKESHIGFLERSDDLRSRDRVIPKRELSRVNTWNSRPPIL